MPDEQTKAQTGVRADASDPLSEAGRIVSRYSALQRSLTLGEAAPWTIPRGDEAKPSKAKTRAAYQRAATAGRLLRQGQRAQAIAAYRQSIEIDPGIAEVHHDLGFACREAGRFDEAVFAFREAARLKPDLVAAQHNLAVTLDQLGRGTEALPAYEATVRLEPHRQMAQFRLGQLYLGRDRRAEAETAFRAAAESRLDPVMARVADGYAAHASGEGGRAQDVLRRVIADTPDCAAAYLVLAEVLAQSGQAAEAAACMRRGIELDPQMVGAWQNFATNTKFTAADHELIEQIRCCLDRPDLTALQRKAIHFALGKAYDDIGDYPAAMPHFDAANQVRSAAVVLDRATLAHQTGAMIKATPPGYIDRCAHLGVKDETPILIVGMPRSGTTLVEQILSSHPQVAAGGELKFWGDKNAAGLGVFSAETTPEVVHRLADEYLAVLRGISPDASRVTDKMPFNFGLLGIIRQVFPRATIVHCRRNPIDTCLSIYCTDFETSIDFAGERGSLVFFYRQYQRLMAHWHEVLPSERFIDVDYEALVSDPEPLTRRLVAVCGLPWDDACLAPQSNQRRITTASIWQARQPIYRTSVERWRRYEPWLGELRQLLPEVTEREV
jgi:tetratricopeptide (TPR) repeat protein